MLIIGFLLTGALICYYFSFSMDAEVGIVVLLVINMLSLLLFIWSREKNVLYRNNYLKHSNILILGFVIVFFQIPLEYVLGNITTRFNFFLPEPDYIYKTVLALSISLLSFLLGYLVFKKVRFLKKNTKKELRAESTFFLFIGTVLSFFLYLYAMGKSYFLGGYAEIEFTPLMTYSNVLFFSLACAYLVQKSINLGVNKRKITLASYFGQLNPILLVIIFVYLILVLASGDRGPFISMFMFLLGCFLYTTQNKIKLIIIVPGMISVILLIMFIGIARNPDLATYSFLEKFAYVQEYSNRTEYFSKGTIELAGSFRTANVSMAEIPRNYDFFYGEFLLKKIFSVVPGLASLLNNMFFQGDPSYLNTPASFITYLIQGDNPRYGDGTVCVADIYMDFGVIGCVFFFFLFGGGVRRMEEVFFDKKNRTSLFFLVVSISYFALAITIGRKSIFDPLVMGFRIFLFLYLNMLFTRMLR